MDIFYQIRPFNVHAHLFKIDLSISKPAKNQVLSLPSWIAGSYLIRDFAKHIISMQASDDQGDIKITALDKNHWQINNAQGSLKITYQMYAFEQSVRGAFLSIERGFFNGCNVLLAVEGQLKKPCFLAISPLPNWRIATSLPLHQKAKQRVIYKANNYEDLIDHPVEMAELSLIEFNTNLNNTQSLHHIAISGKHQTNRLRLQTDVQKICEYHQTFFSQTPFDYYLFLLLVTQNGYGGLEHKNSSSLICQRTDIPTIYTDKITPEYTRLLGLFSHEYLHAWWVKRLKPKNFKQFDYNKENYTAQLWIFEGFTSYYDELALLRVELLTPAQYLSLFAQTIAKVEFASAKDKQTLADSSFTAWTKFYQQDENAPNAVISYYTKGALLAFVLDIEIRKASNNTHSLDSVMRILWQQYQAIGLEDDTITKVVNNLTQQDFSGFFDDFVNNTKPLPLLESFAYVGVDYKTIAKPEGLGFNCDYKGENGFAKVSKVYDHTSAQTGGLYVNDVIIAINGVQVLHKDLSKTFNRYAQQTALKISLFREGILTHIELILEHNKANLCTLDLIKKPSIKVLKQQQQWFYGDEK